MDILEGFMRFKSGCDGFWALLILCLLILIRCCWSEQVYKRIEANINIGIYVCTHISGRQISGKWSKYAYKTKLLRQIGEHAKRKTFGWA